MKGKHLAANIAISFILFTGLLSLALLVAVLARMSGASDLGVGFLGGITAVGVPPLMSWLIDRSGVM